MIATREEWLRARRELLGEEKELTRRSDALAAKRRELPWVSCGGSSFNDDFSFVAESGGYNFRTVTDPASLARLQSIELMALSCFVLEARTVYHTYTTMDRGTDALNPAWQLLDRTPLGRRDEMGGFRKRDEVSQ